MNLRYSNLKVLIDIPLSYSLLKRQQSPFTIVLPNHKAQMSFENVVLRRFLLYTIALCSIQSSFYGNTVEKQMYSVIA